MASSTKDTAQTSSKADEISVAPSSTPGLLTLNKPLETAGAGAGAPSPSRSKPRNTKKKDSTAKRQPPADQRAAIDIPNTRSKSQPDSSATHGLSTSAPLPNATRASKKQQRDAAVPPIAEADSDRVDALTWQQQLLGAGTSSKKKQQPAKDGKRNANKNKHHADSVQAQADALAAQSALTWQQELFNASSKVKRGPHFDVFADARDAETFGDAAPSRPDSLHRSGSVGTDVQPQRSSRPASGKARKGKTPADGLAEISVDDVFNNSPVRAPASARPIAKSAGNEVQGHKRHPSLPMTPAKKTSSAQLPYNSSPIGGVHLAPPSSSADIMAYAGPDFHNSPSAASLPAPKFMNRQSKQESQLTRARSAESTSPADSSSGEDEGDGDAADESMEMHMASRSVRGATAPPDLVAPAPPAMDKSATIENLLARLMGGTGV